MLTGIFSIFGLYYEDVYSVRKINTYLVRLLYFFIFVRKSSWAHTYDNYGSPDLMEGIVKCVWTFSFILSILGILPIVAVPWRYTFKKYIYTS